MKVSHQLTASYRGEEPTVQRDLTPEWSACSMKVNTKLVQSTNASLGHTADSNGILPYLIRCVHSIDALSPEWPDASPITMVSKRENIQPVNFHIFQTTSFLRVWEQTYGVKLNAQLCLVEVRSPSGEPILFLPLVITKSQGMRILSFTDHGVADYNAPVLFHNSYTEQFVWDATNAKQLWQNIIRTLPEFDIAIIGNMPEKIGEALNPLFLLSDIPNGASSHLTTLNHPWKVVEKSLRRPRRIRRNLRHLEELGNCEFHIAETKQDRERYLEFLLQQKQQRFIETKVPGFETYPEKKAYFTLATEAYHEVGALHFSALTSNDKIIACMWGLVSGSHYYGIMIASKFNQWAKYSPGHVIHYLLLQNLQQHGYDCLDLGVGDEEWKLRSCDVTVPLKKMIYCNTLRGKIYNQYLKTMAAARATRIWQLIRPLKWKLIRLFRP